jgi:hypothetical protein
MVDMETQTVAAKLALDFNTATTGARTEGVSRYKGACTICPQSGKHPSPSPAPKLIGFDIHLPPLCLCLSAVASGKHPLRPPAPILIDL